MTHSRHCEERSNLVSEPAQSIRDCFVVLSRNDGKKKNPPSKSCQNIYGSGNVPVFVVEKPYNFLQFRHTGYAQEWQHLKTENEALSQAVIDKIYELHDQGVSQNKISEQLDISPATVNKYLKRR